MKKHTDYTGVSCVRRTGRNNSERFGGSIRGIFVLSTMTFCNPNIEVDALALGAAAVAEGARNTVSQQQKRSEVSWLSCALRTVDPNITLAGPSFPESSRERWAVLSNKSIAMRLACWLLRSPREIQWTGTNSNQNTASYKDAVIIEVEGGHCCFSPSSPLRPGQFIARTALILTFD